MDRKGWGEVDGVVGGSPREAEWKFWVSEV